MASGLAKTIATAVVEVSPDTSAFGGKLQAGLGTAFGSTGLAVADGMERLGKSLFKKFTIPLAIATAANIAQFQGLEREINSVLTLFGTAPRLVDETYGAMSKGVRQVSADVGGLEKDIAGGLYQAISAGVPKGGVFEFLEVSQMAAMADKTADLTTAVDGISTAVNAFASESLTALEASDTLFAGVAEGKTTFGELGQTIGRSAGLAANAGVKFAEFTAIIAQMTKSGLQTSEAVSFLRAAITGMLRPSEEMNKIFQGVGFQTAEAAVPVLGLAESMQIMVEAAGGSTSKLQELIGSSEAVTAVLAVTGENAEAFAGTLATVEAGAGRTARAYEIMEGGIGRSFGRLTESFDRLGNVFGEMGSAIVQPVVDTLTMLVSSLVDAFVPLIPIAKAVGSAVGNMMNFFKLPVIKAFTTAILAAAIGVAGLLGVLGLVLVPLAGFIKALTVARLISVFVKGTDAMRASMVAYANSLEASALKNTIFGRGVRALLVPFTALRTALSGVASAATATALTFGAFALAALAIGGLVLAFAKMKKAAEDAAKAQDVFGEGVSRIMDNAGIVENDLPRVFEGVTDSIGATVLANSVLIGQLKEIRDEAGAATASKVLISIGAEMVWKGATPEEAMAEIRNIGAATGINIPISFEGFEEGVKSVEIGFDTAITLAQQLGDRYDDMINSASAAIRETKPLATLLADMLVVATASGEQDIFRDMMGDIEGAIDDAAAFDKLVDNIFKAIEKNQGMELGFSLGSESDLADFFRQLEFANQIIAEIDNTQINIGIKGNIEEIISSDEIATTVNSIKTNISEISEAAGDEMRSLSELIAATEGVFAAGNDAIDASIASIREGIESQIPLFAEYERAVEIGATAYSKATEAWQADVDLVLSSHQTLVDNLSPEAVELFKAQPIAEQVGILLGSVDDVEDKLSNFQARFGSTDLLEDFTIANDMEGILLEAQAIVDTGLSEIAASFEASNPGADWLKAFRAIDAGGGWGPQAQEYTSAVKAETDITIPGPTVTAPTFIGGSTTYTVNVTASSSGKGYRRGLMTAGHQP